MISKKLCHLFSCTEKSYHIHTFKKPASVPKPNPLCALPPVPVNLGCGKADGQRQMTLLKPGQIKKNVHPPKRRLRRQASAKIKKLMTRISCPKRCKQLFLRLKFFVGPKNWDRIKMFRGQPGKTPKDFFSQRKMDILEYKCRFRIDLGLRCSTKSRYNSILFPTLKSQ